MDVKISYGIELEKVPSKISSMLSEFTTQQTEHLIHVAIQLLNISNENVPMVLDLIDQDRIKMAELDKALNDSQMILKGYVAAVEPKEPPNPTVGGTTDVD